METLSIGDKVKVSFPNGREEAGVIAEIKHNGWCDVDFGDGCISHDIPQDRIERLIPISEEEIKEWVKTMSKEDAIKELNPEEHRIDTPFQDLLTKERWEAYRRDVAGQIAVKLANVDNRPPEDVGRYAVETATMVVKHLRDITI